MSPLDRLLDIMAQLRDPHRGCPWDRKQTYATIIPYTVEEVYEVVDAVDRGDMADLREELGDLLFQVVFLARIAEEEGCFDFMAVAQAIGEKLVRRHPHVFADESFESEEALSRAWDGHKALERASKRGGKEPAEAASRLDGIAAALPPLVRAGKLQNRAARAGFDWSAIDEVIAKVREEVAEFAAEAAAGSGHQRLEDELGDILFSCVNVARHAKVDPESALRRANRRFEARFRNMETEAARLGLRLEELAPEKLEELWLSAKLTVG
jgi:MazG family protein